MTYDRYSSLPYEKHKEQRIIFTKAEDEKLIKLVERSGKRPNWKSISAIMKTRSPRQCRERYRNYLNPNIEHSEWTKEEDQIILNQYAILGNQWKKISESLPGRTGNSIRNRYHSLARQQQRMLQLRPKPILPSPVKRIPKEPVEPITTAQDNNVDLSLLFDTISSIPIDSIFFDESSNSN